MEIFFFIIFGYVISLIVWLTLHLIFLALSVILKRNVNSILFGSNVILTTIVQFGFFIWILFSLVEALIHRQWTVVIFLLVFGSLIVGFFQMISNFILMPFLGASVFFVNKADNHIGHSSSEYETKLNGSEGKLAKRVDSKDKVIKKLAIFYLLSFFTHLIYILTHSNQYNIYGWWDYIFTPSFFMLQDVLLFALPVLIYNRFKHDQFIYQSKKYLLTQVLLVDVIWTIGIQVVAILLHSLNII